MAKRSATGRLVAAYGAQPWREIEQRFKSLRWQNPPTLKVWRTDLERVRRKGYSIDRGNYISGVLVLAVPVFNAHREITHTLVVAGVADQLDKARCVEIANDMQAKAAKLSALIFGKE